MRSGKPLTLLVLSAAGLTPLVCLHAAAAKPEAASSWTVAHPRLTCGTDAEGRVSACRFVSDVTRTAGGAERGVVTIVGLDAAGHELGCWNGAPLTGSTMATKVHMLAPTEELGRVVSFGVFVSAWGCWGTPAVLGPRTQVPRASAARDPAVVDEAREHARPQVDESDEHGDPDPDSAWDLGPVLPRPDPDKGC